MLIEYDKCISLITSWFQVVEPNKVAIVRKQERKLEYERRNPPIEINKVLPVRGRDNPGKAKTKTKAKFAPKPGLVQCRNCSRNFDKERIEVHANICKKTTNKKRKPFDAVKAMIILYSSL